MDLLTTLSMSSAEPGEAVKTMHPEYKKYAPQWQKIADVVEGEDAVKARGVAYLKPLGQQNDGEYEAYKSRATLFAATSRTLDAICGMFEAPMIKVADSFLSYLDNMTHDGQNVNELVEKILREVSSFSRSIAIIDMDEAGTTPYVSTYTPMSMFNWRSTYIDGREVVTMACFMEQVEVASNEYDTDLKRRIRVLLLRDGIYTVEIWDEQKGGSKGVSKDTFVLVDTIVPELFGKTLNFIPILVLGKSRIGLKVEKPNLLDITNINLSQYRNSADLEHGRHWTALPTPWAAGFDAKSSLFIGSSTAWISEDPSARCGYLEYTGQGLQALENSQKEKQDQMAILGSRILESDKLAAEAADTHRIRKSGENNIIDDIADTVSIGITKLLKWYLFFFTSNPSVDVTVAINRRQVDINLSPQMLIALMGQVQAGLISWDTYFHNLYSSQIIPPEHTKEQEKALIEMGTPSGLGLLHGAKASTDSQATTRNSNAGNAVGADGGSKSASGN